MRWQKKRWSSNSTLRSTDSSGILQCFRGTTVWAASGGLDMHVPDPFLQTEHRTVCSSVLSSWCSPRWVRIRVRLTWCEIAPLWPGNWSSGCHCWPSLVHCLREVCSTWYGSPLAFHQPSQTHPRLTSLCYVSSFVISLLCTCSQEDSKSDMLEGIPNKYVIIPPK